VPINQIVSASRQTSTARCG